MDLISIIVPVYNVEDYLEKCIDSLLNQTYKNLEIILIDDGSTDNSADICDEYANKYNHVYVYHKKNGGLSSARNLGIEKINKESKYIGFIDSDDYVNTRMYEILYNNIKKYDVGISICEIEDIYDYNHIPVEYDKNFDVCVETSAQFLDNYFNNYCTSTSVCNKLYKREYIEEFKFEVGKIYEDQLYSPKLIYRAGKIVYTNAKLYYYYQRNNSISHGGSDINGWDDLVYAAENYINFGLEVKNKKFIGISVERCLGIIIHRVLDTQASKAENRKWKKVYRSTFKRYGKYLNNYKLKIIYGLFFINPKIFNLIKK